MKRSRHVAAAILALALLAGFYLISGRLIFPAPDPTRLSAVGMIEAEEVNVSSRIAGRIAALDVEEGDRVARGQVVCRIDSTDIANELEKAEAELAQARADLTRNERDLARIGRLFAENVVSAEERDDALTEVELGRATVASAQAQIGYYQDQLRDTEIRAPIAGVVVYKAFQIGEWVTAGTPIVTVDDLSTIWARVDVQETEIARLRVGGPARVALPGRPPIELPGRISAIGQEGEFATERDVRRGRQDVRAFYVKVLLEGDVAMAKPGMTAEVTFDLEQMRDVAPHD